MATESVLQHPEQMVVFRLRTESYCINIFQVHEIIRMRQITPTHSPGQHIRGLINLRGKTVPIIDLSLALGCASSEESDDTRIIVVEGAGGNVGLVVDAVHEVVTLEPETVDSPPPLLSHRSGDLVRGVAKTETGIVTLLNLEQAIVA